MNSQTTTVTSETTVAELKIKTEKALELKAVERALKEAQRLATWETEVLAINSQYRPGSVRQATSDDESLLGHTHGQVCEIICQECGDLRIVNLQDARQCRFCRACKKTANKQKTKLAKVTKRLAGRTVADLERDIEAARAALAAMTAVKVA